MMTAAHFVSASCGGEKCRMCQAPATHKVGEEFFHDDPNTMPRHNLTAYVCCGCFGAIFGVPCSPEFAPFLRPDETHIDDWLDRPRFEMPPGERYARWWLEHARMSGARRLAYQPFIGDKRLFCTHEGKRMRVTGASRLGDVWLVFDFDREHGYDYRVSVDACFDWSATP